MTESSSQSSIDAPDGSPDFLVHNEGDHVGVAVHDVEPGSRLAVHMDTDRQSEIEATETIPLGHKIALDSLGTEAPVIEYGVVVGITRRPISRGELVHVHNIRSARWTASR